MKNSARGDSSMGSELKAVEGACREASRTVEPCDLCLAARAAIRGRAHSVNARSIQCLDYSLSVCPRPTSPATLKTSALAGRRWKF
jgi:hypothetical protein